MNLKRTVAPVAEPVTWLECQEHLRLDDETDKTYVEALIAAAREYAEQATGRALMAQTWQLKRDAFWPGTLLLPCPPLVSVSSITYTDVDGNTQTADASLYTVDTSSEPGRVFLAYNQTWPTTRSIEDAVTVTYTAGYASASVVPQAIKQAIMILVAHWYANREPVTTGSMAQVPMSAESLLGMNHHGWRF